MRKAGNKTVTAFTVTIFTVLALGCSNGSNQQGGSGGGSGNGGAAGDGSGGKQEGGQGAGGTTSRSGGAPSGGAVSAGGNNGSGGSGTGGKESGSGGSGTGGKESGSGGSGTGGKGSGNGGSASGGDSKSSGGAVASGGAGGGAGGASARGGSSGSGGSSAGGTSGTTGPQGPCDIFKAGNTPCVAAHSTTRSLFGAYNGPIYQVRKDSNLTNHGTGGTTKDIMPLSPGGVVDSASQDSFCAGTICTISTIYDQTENHNDLIVGPQATFCPATSGVTMLAGDPRIGQPGGGYESDATKGQTTLNGKKVYGMYVVGLKNYIAVRGPNVAYRAMKTKGVAKGSEPETIYMVLDGKRYTGSCCFDYGNAELLPIAGGNMTMEALYWGSDQYWGGPGDGNNGPWFAADMENGIYKGDTKNKIPTATSIKFAYAMGMLKGYTENRFVLKYGDAQVAKLSVAWDGKRPAGWETKKLEGSIVLGTGGDGSDGCDGTFWEGAMTAGISDDSVDNAVQANIAAAGYGK